MCISGIHSVTDKFLLLSIFPTIDIKLFKITYSKFTERLKYSQNNDI